MNMPATRVQREIYEKVMAISDPAAECLRRWPDFRFEVRQERWSTFSKYPDKPKATFVGAFWSADGHERGLQHEAGRPVATDAQIREAKEVIARQALVNAEYRTATR